MANTCLTEYTVNNLSGEELITLYNALVEIKSQRNDGHDENWLGNILYYTGEVDKLDKVALRGHIGHVEIVDNEQLLFDTVTAWRPMPEAIMMLLEEYPEAELLYASDAGGDEMFTNDPCVVGHRTSYGVYESCPLDEWMYV